MLSMEPPDEFGTMSGDSTASSPSITLRIVRAEEQTSLMMQRYTDYVIEVSDFGRTFEVPHRYSDYETLHRTIQTECPGVTLPAMPPKGVDGTDMMVVKQRKVELEKILRFMLGCQEVLLEKQLSFWKFLNLGNPTVIAGRFVLVPRSRGQTLKTLTKLNEPKYKDDVYRLAHPSVTDLLLEALREFRNGDPGSSHWCRQPGGRNAVCQLLAGALGTCDSGRARLIEADVIGMLLGMVEREESALDDARTALNVIVAREAERFANLLSLFICRGGMGQLMLLAQRSKSQEFVAKLLWLAWDAPTRASFAQPGGQGLRLLQALLQSEIPTCALLGAVLLSGLLAHGDLGSDPAHRAEALRMVRGVLGHPEAAADPQFTKTLCGANAALVRLAGLLDDADLAPLILGMLCAARPPAAKLQRIAGNLASLVGDRGSSVHSEETRARAAELLLHIQGSSATPQQSPSAAPSSGGAAPAVDLERCEGIAEHEESLDKAMRWQLQEALSKSRQALESTAGSVEEVVSIGSLRLQVLPQLDFKSFDSTFTAFKTSRQAFEKVVKESKSLHEGMDRQLLELQTAKPSSLDDKSYQERLVNVERLYSEVKTQREALASADAEAKQKQATAEASTGDLKRATEEVRRIDEEVSSLRLRKSEKESEATKLRHKANMPNLDQMKRQAADSLERNTAQAKELQVIGQRVQQGDPDYLKDGESRESKIAELAGKLTQLKKQHQVLLQQQKELDIDPVQLGNQAAKFETEASEMQARMTALESRRLDLDRERSEKTSQSSRDTAEAKGAQERRSTLASRVQSAEAEVRSQMSSLQPLIQDHHAGWQRLLGQQKKLDTDHNSLCSRLAEAKRAASTEATTRSDLIGRVQGLVTSLQSFQSFLESLGSEPIRSEATKPTLASSPNAFEEDFDFGAEVATKPTPTASPNAFEEDFDFGAEVATKPAPTASPNVFEEDFEAAAAALPAEAPPPTAAAPPAAAPPSMPTDIVDDFDAFLKEEADVSLGSATPSASTKPSTSADVFADDDDFGITPKPAASDAPPELVAAPPEAAAQFDEL